VAAVVEAAGTGAMVSPKAELFVACADGCALCSICALTTWPIPSSPCTLLLASARSSLQNTARATSETRRRQRSTTSTKAPTTLTKLPAAPHPLLRAGPAAAAGRRLRDLSLRPSRRRRRRSRWRNPRRSTCLTLGTRTRRQRRRRRLSLLLRPRSLVVTVRHYVTAGSLLALI
jgi:hypothetical protein